MSKPISLLLLNRLYITCRLDRTGTNKINPNYHDDLELMGFSNIKYHSYLCAEFFTFEDASTKYFLFLGSNETKDWFYNFFFPGRVVPYFGVNEKIKVHSGFIAEYKLLRDWVLTEAEGTSKDIIVTGHSLGSALATLGALDIQYNTKKPITCIVSGTPRVGNQAFVDSYNRRVPDTLRIVRGNDIVSKLPPKCFGFAHVGTLKHIGSWWSLRIIRDHDIKLYEPFLEGAIFTSNV